MKMLEIFLEKPNQTKNCHGNDVICSLALVLVAFHVDLWKSTGFKLVRIQINSLTSVNLMN